MKELDLTTFKNAISSLNSIYNRFQKEQDIDLRDGVIQRFEYCFSLCVKTLQSFIDMQPTERKEVYTFNEIIRISNRYELLRTNLEQWDLYRKARNLTSHTYNENLANQLLEIIPEFYEDLVFLLKRLEETI